MAVNVKCYRCGDWPCVCKDGQTIIHGDCREVLPLLPKASLVLTDMPYGEVNRASGGLRNLDKGNADVVTTVDATLLPSLLNADTIYVFCGTEQVSSIRSGFVERGYTTRLCVWEKTNPSPMNGEYFWLSAIEACVFARSTGALFTRNCASPVWRFPVARDQLHPTQKPTSLFSYLIESSSAEGDTVCDPFMGAGTSLVSAKRRGRRGLGIEIDERYCEIAANRLRQGVLTFEESTI